MTLAIVSHNIGVMTVNKTKATRGRTARKHYESGVNAKLDGINPENLRPNVFYKADFMAGYNDTRPTLPEASNDLTESFSVGELMKSETHRAAHRNPVRITKSNKGGISKEFVFMTLERFEQLIKGEDK